MSPKPVNRRAMHVGVSFANSSPGASTPYIRELIEAVPVIDDNGHASINCDFSQV
jgi:hypothetical protein